MRLKADDDDVTIFSFALQIFFCQHITLGHFDNTEPGEVYDTNGYLKGPTIYFFDGGSPPRRYWSIKPNEKSNKI